MHLQRLFFLVLLIGVFPSFNQATAKPGASRQQASLSFTENKGQITDQYGQPRNDIDFKLSHNGINVFIGNGQIHYQWMKQTAKDEQTEMATLSTYRMDVTLIGANKDAALVTEQTQDDYELYYLPTTQPGAKARAYQKITYKEVYPNIDWVVYIKNGQVEYDFVVRPGGKLSDIKIKYGGATKLAVDEEGRLVAETPMGRVREEAPVSRSLELRGRSLDLRVTNDEGSDELRGTNAEGSFQSAERERTDVKFVESEFVLEGDVLSFRTGPYEGTLIIDPVLSWSTYYGGPLDETIKGGGVTGDAYGNGYLAGTSNSATNIATTGAYQQTVSTGTDAFLVKFNSAGVRQWATYYGGTSSDQGWAAACDAAGNVYLSGYSNSNGMATAGSHQDVKAGTDALLVKFDSAGNRLWATYYGGSSTEQGWAVTCDASDNVIMAGYTNNSASGVATPGVHQTTGGGGNDGFIVKFNSAGVRQWGTYYGGNATDQIYSISCDNDKNVFVTGYTNNSTSGLASAGAHQPAPGGGQEGFIAKFDSTGTRQWGTYYGGSGQDRCLGIATDHAGSCYVTGYTLSTSDIATPGSHQSVFGGGSFGADAFVVKLDANGVRQWGTYYGDNADESGNSICSDGLGHIYINGFTNSSSGIATPGVIKDTLDVQDAFIVKFDTAGTRIWGTYFGGEYTDLGFGIYCNDQSKVFIGGLAGSMTNIATPGSHQTVHGGSTDDAFFAVIDDCMVTAPALVTGPDTVCRSGTYTYSVTPLPGASSYTWMVPSGWSGTSTTDSIIVTAGNNTDTIKVVANYACGLSTETVKEVVVSPLPLIAPSGFISICSGDSAVLTASAGVSYQWLNGGAMISGATASTYTVHSAGEYAAIVTNSLGCADTSATDTIIEHPLPVPVISINNLTLSTGSYVSYQWNHNGAPITGATSSSYIITVISGLYSVTVTDSNGCVGTSAPFNADDLGVEEMNGGQRVVVYPNPVRDVLFIDAGGDVDVVVYSMEGRVVIERKSVKQVDMAGLANGVYMVRIMDRKGRSWEIRVTKYE